MSGDHGSVSAVLVCWSLGRGGEREIRNRPRVMRSLTSAFHTCAGDPPTYKNCFGCVRVASALSPSPCLSDISEGGREEGEGGKEREGGRER